MKRKRQPAIYLQLLVITLVLLNSCWTDDFEDLSKEDVWQTSVALPLGTISLGFDSFSGFDTALLDINPGTGYPYWIEYPSIDLNSSLVFDVDGLTDDTDDIRQILIRMNFYNGFPVEISAQGYFADDTGFYLDSVFPSSPLIIQAGHPSETGERISAVHTRGTIVLDESKIAELQNTNELIFEIDIPNVSLDSTFIQYYPDYKIDVQVGIIASFVIDTIEIN